MVQSKTASASGGNWTSVQAYVLATICLVIGIAVGYLLRGSAATDSRPAETAATAPAAMGGMNPAQPTPAQMKQMADAQAAPILEQLKNAPNDPALLSNAGNIYYDAAQYQEAISYYSRALQADPKNANVRTDMGTAYFYLGDSDRALKEFQTSLKDDPKHAQTLFNMGMVQWQGKGDVQGAVVSWEKLLKVAPDYPDRAKVEQMIAKAKEHTTMAPGTKTDKPAKM